MKLPVLGLFGTVGAFALGWAVAPRRPAPAAEIVRVEVPVPVRAAAPGAPVAASEPPADDPRLRWCEARLRAMQYRAVAATVPWPEGDLGLSDPDAFVPAVEEVVARCGGRVELTDCEAYPCVAVLEPGTVVARDCDALSSLGEAYFDVLPRVCPDGSVVDVPVLTAFDSDLLDEHAARFAPEGRGEGLWLDGMRLIFRRTDEAASSALHLCP